MQETKTGNRAMKVLHILFSSGFGGLEKYAVETAKRMKQAGHNIIFVCRDETPTFEYLAQSKSFEIVKLSPAKYVSLPTMLFIRSLVKHKDIDLVHAHHSADLGLVAPALFNMPQIPLIYSNYMWVPSNKKDIYHRLEYGRVDKVLTASGYLKKNILEHLPVRNEQVEVIPYGIDLEHFDSGNGKGELRAELGIEKNIPLIGVISRLDPLKGQMETIRAMPALLQKYPDAHLVLAGDETPELEGKYKPLLEKEVEHLGLQSKIHFTGYADDTAEILADLTIYLLPSHHETFSLACLEAMAMGKAIIGTNSGGTPEMLSEDCGLLCEAKNAEDISGKIVLLLDDKNRRDRLGDNAKKKIRQEYDMRLVSSALSGLYRNLEIK